MKDPFLEGIPENPEGQNLHRLRDVIGEMESGNRYDIRHPKAVSGKQAVGKYGIVPEIWFDEFPEMGYSSSRPGDVDRFLASPEAQDEYFNKIAKKGLKETGGDVAKFRAWYYGGPNAAEELGTGKEWAPQYAVKDGQTIEMPSRGGDNQKFMQKMMAAGYRKPSNDPFLKGIARKGVQQAQAVVNPNAPPPANVPAPGYSVDLDEALAYGAPPSKVPPGAPGDLGMSMGPGGQVLPWDPKQLAEQRRQETLDRGAGAAYYQAQAERPAGPTLGPNPLRKASGPAVTPEQYAHEQMGEKQGLVGQLGNIENAATDYTTGQLANFLQGKDNFQVMGERIRHTQENLRLQQEKESPEFKTMIAQARVKHDAGQALTPEEETALAKDPSVWQEIGDVVKEMATHPWDFASQMGTQMVKDLPTMLLTGEGIGEVMNIARRFKQASAAGVIAQTSKKAAMARKLAESTAQNVGGVAAINAPEGAARAEEYGGKEFTRDVVTGALIGAGHAGLNKMMQPPAGRPGAVPGVTESVPGELPAAATPTATGEMPPMTARDVEGVQPTQVNLRPEDQELMTSLTASGRSPAEAQAFVEALKQFTESGNESLPQAAPEAAPAAPQQAPMAPAQPAAPTMEPWQLSRNDYYRQLQEQAPGQPREAFSDHKTLVHEAVLSGSEVPDHVLADYPDVQALARAKPVMAKNQVEPTQKPKVGYDEKGRLIFSKPEEVVYTPSELESLERDAAAYDFHSAKKSSEETSSPSLEMSQRSSPLSPGVDATVQPPSGVPRTTAGLPPTSKKSLLPGADQSRRGLKSGKGIEGKVPPEGKARKGAWQPPTDIFHVGKHVFDALSVPGKTGIRVHPDDLRVLDLEAAPGMPKSPKERWQAMSVPVAVDNAAPRLSAIAEQINLQNVEFGEAGRHHIGGEKSGDVYHGNDMARALLDRPRDRKSLIQSYNDARAKLSGEPPDREFLPELGMPEEPVKPSKPPEAPASTDEEGLLFEPKQPYKANQEDMFGNKGRTASQGLMKGKVPDKGLEGTPMDLASKADEQAKADLDQTSLFERGESYKEKKSPNQVDFLDQLDHIPKDDPAAYKAGQDAKQAVADLSLPPRRGLDAGTVGDRNRLASQISDEFRANGFVDLRGKVAKTPEDVATLAQVFRDPRFETFRVWWVDTDGKILAVDAYTSRLPSMAAIQPAEAQARVRHAGEMKYRSKKLGAAGFYISHNHPSTNPRPSVSDFGATWHMQKKLPDVEFKGHIIIDHVEYGVITPEDMRVVADKPTGWSSQNLPPHSVRPIEGAHGKPDPNLQNIGAAKGLLGRSVISPGEIASVANSLQAPKNHAILVFSNASGRVIGLSSLHLSDLKGAGAEGRIRNLAVAYGGRPSLVLPKGGGDKSMAVTLWHQGYFLDVIYDNGYGIGSVYRDQGGRSQGAVNLGFKENSTARGKELPFERVSEPEKPYAAKEEEKKGSLGKVGAGAKEFVQKDVVDRGKGFIQAIKEVGAGLTHIFTPRVGVPEKNLNAIYKLRADREKLMYRYESTMRHIKQMFNKAGESESLAFIDRMKRGEEQPTPELQAVATLYRRLDDEIFRMVKHYKPGLPYLKNHFRVFWKKFPGFEGEQMGLEGEEGPVKPTLQGGKGFLKAAVLPDISSGIERGGIPVTTNPQSLLEMGHADAMRFISAQRMWTELQRTGQVEFVKHGEKAPEGFSRLDDNIARTYFRRPEGMEHMGDYYVEANTARVLNNFLSIDWIREKALGRGLLALKNLTTAIELSVSPFHFAFETVEAMASQQGIGFTKIFNEGKFKEGLKDIVTSPLAARSLATTGGKALKYFKDPDSFIKTVGGQKFLKQFPDARELIEYLFAGGGKLTMHEDYKLNSADAFSQNLHSKNYIGAALRALPAANEVIMKPLFEVYIPRLKIGLFFKEMSQQLSQHADDLASGKVTREKLARDTWDRVENRFGEMNFDNLFWNRTFKSSMQMLFRSVTWKLGTLRGVGKAGVSQIKEIGEALRLIKDAEGKKGDLRMPKLDPGVAWVLGVMTTTAAISSVIQMALTGKPPSDLKDFVFPKDGGKDENGNDTRLSVPTYLRDLLHLEHDPLGYVGSSMSGLASRTIESMQNRDYFGDYIYDPDAPMYEKLAASVKNVVPQPFSVKQIVNLSKGKSSTPEKALAFAGFVKAPKEYIKTEFQRQLMETFEKQAGERPKTPAEKETKAYKKEFFEKMRTGKVTGGDVTEAIQRGIMNPKSMKASFRRSGQSPMQFMWQAMSRENKALLEPLMSDEERKILYVPKLPKLPAAPVPSGAK